ncbi:DNA recombination protein RmuC [Candidatus Peregrinibacteria bacterium]|nr:DNA recombination protein RmuC [Candidatus Peregrinibacteria bacterium]
MENLFMVVIIAVIALSIWYNWKTHQSLQKLNQKKDEEKSLGERLDILSQHMTTNLSGVTNSVLHQLNEVTKQVNERLKESTEMTERTHRSVGERLDNAAKAVNTITGRLAKIEEANQRIFEVGKDIASLQEILRAPKLRGVLGELFLGDLLAQILPKELFTLQYSFKNDTKVDAVIHFPNQLLVPVDAKFPLENFKKVIEFSEEKQAKAARKNFYSDVKKHIDDIANKYIVQDEGTLDFALMYIPAENVYYEMIVKTEEDNSICQYAISKKVIPVSPNSFYIYLQAILMGFKGLQINKNAKEILSYISNLKTTFTKFGEDFELVGTHLNRAKNSYDNSEKRLDNFEQKLKTIEMLEKQEEKILLE